MGTVIVPTVGRRVWYYPGNSLGGMVLVDPNQPCDAGVACVITDREINISVADHTGNMFAREHVMLLQGDDLEPADNQHYCTWMPYQKAQAK